jgi:LacI family transcriptional regulator
MSPSPTLRDLAKHLGLGKSTVQRVLSGAPNVTESTRRLVLAAAEKMGYKPDPVFSILGSRKRHRRSHFLSLAYIGRQELADASRREFVGVDFFASLRERALSLGYNIKRVEPDEIGAGNRLMKVLYNRGISGVVIGQVRTPDHETILTNTDLPVVCCGRIDSLPLHTVRPDVGEIVRLAWQKMFDAGYRRIGAALCAHIPPCRDDSERLATVLGCQAESLSHENHVPPLSSEIGNPSALLDWFHKNRPDAILGFHPGQYYILADAGIDMSRVGFASLHVDPAAAPPLIAGVAEPLDLIPNEAVNFLDRLIHHRTVGVPEKPLHILIPGQWYDGESLPRKRVAISPAPKRRQRIAKPARS